MWTVWHFALTNSKSSQDALEKQISDNAALDNNLVLAAKGAIPRQLTRKELKKLRQKTKKILNKLQDNENNETHEDESNLNESVENLIDPNQNSLNTNGSDETQLPITIMTGSIPFCSNQFLAQRVTKMSLKLLTF